MEHYLTSTAAAGSRSEGAQFGIYRVVGLGQYIDQVLGLARVLLREERIGGASVVGPPCTPDAMNVVLGVVRVVEVDDELHVVHVWGK